MSMCARLTTAALTALLLTGAAGAADRGDAAAIAARMIQEARPLMVEKPAAVEPLARRYAGRLAGLPQSLARTTALAKLYWMAGEAATRQIRFDVARARLLRADQLARASNDAQTIADVAMSRASLDDDSGSPVAAIRGYQRALRIYQLLGSGRSQSIALQNLGNLYKRANDPVRATRYIRQAAGVYTDEPIILATIHNSLGGIHADRGDNRRAHEEYAVGARIARAADMPLLEMQMLGNDAHALLDMGDVRGADAALTRGRALVSNGTPATETLLAVSSMAAMAKRDAVEAEHLMDAALRRLGPHAPVTGDRDIHDMAYRVYKAIGDDRRALLHHEVATRLDDQAVKATLDAQNALLGARFDYASQDLRIAQLNADRLRREGEAQRSAMRLTWTAGALVLAAMAAGLSMAIRSRRRVDAANRRLAASNADLERAMAEVVERERSERLAIQLAEHDALTSLPNRRHLRGNLLRDVVDEGGSPTNVVMMLMDLDRFKPINDIHGHEVGDVLLVEVADRLRSLCEGRRAKAVRLGGDEFVIVAELGEEDDADGLAAEAIAALGTPFDIDTRRLTIGVSIGMSKYGKDGVEVSELLRKADISMYEAKRSGRNTFRFFDEQMDLRLRARAQTEADLRVAVQEEQIDVHYQPIHSFEKGRTSSFEALARWTHPLRGAVSPEEFIPIAEEIGIISALTDQVLRQACRAAREWPEDVSVSVNLSPVLLGDEWIGPRIFGILAAEGLAPHRLVVEITETAVISDLKHAAEVITSFRNSGIRVALDDFGKGHSSLSQLHELAFDYLKLDSSFVRTLDNVDSMKISTAVSGLARAMDLPVTAEGIETDEAADTLRRLGFDYAQGFLYGKPMTAPQAKEMAWTVDREPLADVA